MKNVTYQKEFEFTMLIRVEKNEIDLGWGKTILIIDLNISQTNRK